MVASDIGQLGATPGRNSHPARKATLMVVKMVGFEIEGLAFGSGSVAHELCDWLSYLPFLSLGHII